MKDSAGITYLLHLDAVPMRKKRQASVRADSTDDESEEDVPNIFDVS